MAGQRLCGWRSCRWGGLAGSPDLQAASLTPDPVAGKQPEAPVDVYLGADTANSAPEGRGGGPRGEGRAGDGTLGRSVRKDSGGWRPPLY